MQDSINWAFKNPTAAKYNIDTQKIGTAGQSCGGIQSLHVGSSDSRVKVITLFNSGSLNAADSAAARTVKVPIGYFLGGPSDIAYSNVCKTTTGVKKS
jgi:dienelactone hydrolase